MKALPARRLRFLLGLILGQRHKHSNRQPIVHSPLLSMIKIAFKLHRGPRFNVLRAKQQLRARARPIGKAWDQESRYDGGFAVMPRMRFMIMKTVLSTQRGSVLGGAGAKNGSGRWRGETVEGLGKASYRARSHSNRLSLWVVDLIPIGALERFQHARFVPVRWKRGRDLCIAFENHNNNSTRGMGTRAHGRMRN